MRMNNRLTALLLHTTAVIALTGCHDEENQTAGVGTVTYKVAVIMPSSAECDWNRTISWAKENLEQAQNGFRQITRIETELKNEDDADLQAYIEQVAADETYVAVIGPYSSRNAALAARACAKSRKPLLLPIATSTEFQRTVADQDHIWNLSQSDLTQCEILLTQAAVSEVMGVTLLTSDDDYGQSFSDWFAFQAVELGLNVDNVLTYSNEEELKSSVAQLDDHTQRNRMLLFAPSQVADVLCFDKAYSETDKETFPIVYCSDVAYSKSLEGHVENDYEGISPSADPASGFIQAYRTRFGEDPMAGEAHLFDAISLLGYALAAYGDTDLNNGIGKIISGRETWNRSWLASDMQAALIQLQAGHNPDLNGVTGDWTFDQKYHSSVLNTTYCHWTLRNGRYKTLEYLSPDGSGRTTSTLQVWETQAQRYQQFDQNQQDFQYGELNDNWAIVIGTSDTWANYRHQADAMAMYQILKRHGYDEDHIILIIADNLAYDPHNLYPGVVKVTPDGENLYTDLHVDYNVADINITDLKEILMGRPSDRLPQTLSSGKNDNLFIFWCGHGSPNYLSWGSYGIVYGWQIRDLLQEMNQARRYRKILFAMDACYSGTIGKACEGIPGVLFITAANAYEPSKADMKDPEMGVWLSNGFTRAFQDIIDENPSITLRDLYYTLARVTVGSHATVYNITNYGNMYTNTLQEFLK